MDKLLHFSLAFVLAASLNAYKPKKEANTLTLSACVGKEVWDAMNLPNYFDWQDLAAGAAGVFTASYVLSKIQEKTVLENLSQNQNVP